MVELPRELLEEYPFKKKYFSLKSGHKIHYVDEGTGTVMLMLHGNPTWSFYYRKLISQYSQSYRVIVPDHLGCGLSDRPQDYNYTLAEHISNLKELLNSLNIETEILFVHDWGGAMGFALAASSPSIKKIIALNTAAYVSDYIPWQIKICRFPYLGGKAIRVLNAFAMPATYMAVNYPMPKLIKKGYLFPYNNYKNRVAIAAFVKDIPMNKQHPSYQTMLNIQNNLPSIKAKKLFLWGKKDFCFNDYFLKRWQNIYPDADFHECSNAGHYVLEDALEECVGKIQAFLR